MGQDAASRLAAAELFARAGIDVSQIRFHLEQEPGSFILTGTIGTQRVGFIIVSDAYGGDGKTYPIIDKVEINDAFKGKGIGSFFYMAAARREFDQSGRVLHISELTSNDAKAVWSRFLKMGYAESISSEYGDSLRLRRDVVDSPLGAEAWTFVEERLGSGQ